MDVHRCRFVPYPPSTINSVAFSHSQIGRTKKSDTPLRLAIGRANGDIEIWNPLNGAWFQETILRGGKDRSVDGLAWIQDLEEEDRDGKILPGKLRLFSIGYTTTVTEWDLERLQPVRQSSGNHGEIWCLAAQPQITQAQQHENGGAGASGSQNLIVGCTDGALVLYSTADNDLKLQRVLVRPSAKKAKIISVNFQDRNIVIAGCTDSTIRVYDSRNGTSIRSISLGAGPLGGPKEIIVWAVKCLPNGNIVSGDSTGELRIWDGKTYTLIQRIKSHRQDILSLATSADGSTIFSGGMDRRTVIYKQAGGGLRSRWAEVSHRRLHSHDVKTMASFEGRGMSFVVSGGPDATPIVLPLREFGAENQRMLPFLPQQPIVQSVPARRFLMSWWGREVHIWRVIKLTQLKESAESDSGLEERSRNQKLVAKIIIKGEANINSASMTSNGGLLALSTNNEVKLFQLRSRSADQRDALRVSKLDLSDRISKGGARLAQFSPDGRWLVIIRRDSRVIVTRIVGDVTKSPSAIKILSSFAKLPRLDRKADKISGFGGLRNYERSINQIAFSSNSRILAVSDLAGYIDTWILKGDGNQNGSEVEHMDSDVSSESSSNESNSDEAAKSIALEGLSWTRNPSASSIPKLPAAAVILSFRPSGPSMSVDVEDRLLVVTATSAVFEFEVMQGRLTDWSRRNPTTKFPDEFKGLRDQAMGCFWDVAESRERLWLYGSKWMFMFDLSRDFPAEEEAKGNRKRKHLHITGQDNPRKGTSGAGSKIPDEELNTGMSRKMQRVIHDENSDVREFGLRNHRGILDDEDEDEDNIEYGKASEGTDPGQQMVHHGGDVVASQAGGHTEYDDDAISEHPPHWWHTYKYRPIMGIVPISGETVTTGVHASLEVALVERPEWELELPPRYYGDQEWEKRGL